jgi:hypothetical protein
MKGKTEARISGYTVMHPGKGVCAQIINVRVWGRFPYAIYLCTVLRTQKCVQYVRQTQRIRSRVWAREQVA